MGIIALALILFAGGLDTQWQDVRPVWKAGVALATLGTLVTAALVGLFAYIVVGMALKEALLLGAIVSSTDAAAVFRRCGCDSPSGSQAEAKTGHMRRKEDIPPDLLEQIKAEATMAERKALLASDRSRNLLARAFQALKSQFSRR
jgi:Sodium/hydrogen exchanger family